MTRRRTAKDEDDTHCVVCREPMHPEARRCKHCDTYKKCPNLPMIITILSVIGGFLGVVSAIAPAWFYVSEYHSNTQLKVSRANTDVIFVKVWNTGRHPSALVRYRLVFDEIPAKQATLLLSTADTETANNVIDHGAPVLIRLQASIREQLPKSILEKEYTKPDLDDLHGDRYSKTMTLFVDVQESNDSAGETHTRFDRFPAEQIKPFLSATWSKGIHD